MKKFFRILTAILFIALITSTSVLAAPESKNVTLVSISYTKSGIVLTFDTSGLTKKDLMGSSFSADSNEQKMSCQFVDNSTTVRCRVAKSLAAKGGYRVVLAGYVFYGELPQSRTFKDEEASAACTAQTAIYNLDATCTHGIQVNYNFSVPPGGNLADVLQQILDLWSSFGDPLTVNSVTFLGCQP